MHICSRSAEAAAIIHLLRNINKISNKVQVTAVKLKFPHYMQSEAIKKCLPLSQGSLLASKYAHLAVELRYHTEKALCSYRGFFLCGRKLRILCFCGDLCTIHKNPKAGHQSSVYYQLPLYIREPFLFRNKQQINKRHVSNNHTSYQL